MNSKIRKLTDPGYKKLCQDLQKLHNALAAKCAEQQNYLQPNLAFAARYSIPSMKRKYSR